MSARSAGKARPASEVAPRRRTLRWLASRPFAPRVIAAGACLAAALPLAACGAGQSAETTFVIPATSGVNAQAGPILIRNAYVVGPGVQGSSVNAYLALFNTGADDDQLVSASSAAAADVTLDTPGPVTVAAGSGSLLNPGGGSVRLGKLTKDAPIGTNLPLTLTFAKEGDVHLLVPVDAPPASPEPASPSASSAG